MAKLPKQTDDWNPLTEAAQIWAASTWREIAVYFVCALAVIVNTYAWFIIVDALVEYG